MVFPALIADGNAGLYGAVRDIHRVHAGGIAADEAGIEGPGTGNQGHPVKFCGKHIGVVYLIDADQAVVRNLGAVNLQVVDGGLPGPGEDRAAALRQGQAVAATVKISVEGLFLAAQAGPAVRNGDICLHPAAVALLEHLGLHPFVQQLHILLAIEPVGVRRSAGAWQDLQHPDGNGQGQSFVADRDLRLVLGQRPFRLEGQIFQDNRTFGTVVQNDLDLQPGRVKNLPDSIGGFIGLGNQLQPDRLRWGFPQSHSVFRFRISLAHFERKGPQAVFVPLRSAGDFRPGGNRLAVQRQCRIGNRRLGSQAQASLPHRVLDGVFQGVPLEVQTQVRSILVLEGQALQSGLPENIHPVGFFRLSLRAQADGEGIPFQAVFPDDVGEVLAVDRPGGDLLVSFAPPGLDNGTAWGILRQGRKGEQIAGPLIVLHHQSIVRLLRRKLRIQWSFRRSRLSFLPEAQLCQPGGLFRQFLLDEFLFRQLLFHGFCRSRQCAEHQQHRHNKAQKSLHVLPSLQKKRRQKPTRPNFSLSLYSRPSPQPRCPGGSIMADILARVFRRVSPAPVPRLPSFPVTGSLRKGTDSTPTATGYAPDLDRIS